MGPSLAGSAHSVLSGPCGPDRHPACPPHWKPTTPLILYCLYCALTPAWRALAPSYARRHSPAPLCPSTRRSGCQASSRWTWSWLWPLATPPPACWAPLGGWATATRPGSGGADARLQPRVPCPCSWRLHAAAGARRHTLPPCPALTTQPDLPDCGALRGGGSRAGGGPAGASLHGALVCCVLWLSL